MIFIMAISSQASGILIVISIIFAILIALIGSFLSWICSFALYGYGKLIDNSCIIVEQNENKVDIPLNEPIIE